MDVSTSLELNQGLPRGQHRGRRAGVWEAISAEPEERSTGDVCPPRKGQRCLGHPKCGGQCPARSPLVSKTPGWTPGQGACLGGSPSLR